jgi:hypothetical protein
MACKKDHSELQLQYIMEQLPDDQGGRGRHKCAACAYEAGYQDGLEQKEQIDLSELFDSLEESQASAQRHKSPHAAYAKGYLDGVNQYYQEK